ncbi:peptidoglycan-binding protein [Streptomyces sp. NPDC057877]|uniref:peptidoglycan-binding protein n=1 Tax=Streptomyces sp. NPDC057877 TaxID=3346269 RepID=UPI003698AE00
MAEPKGHPCPQCGAHRGTDNTPSCACGRQASDALRHARTAEQAAAEDFDPLRIRPYVDLEGDGADAGTPEAQPSPAAPDAEDTAAETTVAPHAVHPAAPPTAETTVAPHAVHPAAPPTAETTMAPHAVHPAAPPTAETTMAPHAVHPAAPPTAGTAPLPTPLAPSGTEPSATDLRLFEAGEGPPPSAPDAPVTSGRGPRRRRTVLLGATAAVVAVVAAAGLANGVFSYDAPTRDDAMPQDVREAVPDTQSTESSSARPSPSGTSSATASASASPSPSTSESASPSASASSAEPSTSTSPSPSSTPTSPPPTAAATGTLSPTEEDDQPSPGPVLRRGDRGPEVTELQQRLRQLWLFNGDANGYYSRHLEDAVRTYQWSRGVQPDELGVYDVKTRARLEAETSEP